MHGKPDRKELRTFGFSLSVVCLIWAGVLAWRGKAAPVPWLLGAAPVLALFAAWAPAALGPLHRVWMPVARGVAHALTWVLLSAVFFLVFTPYGMIARLLGKDPLERKLDPARSSYWIPREDGSFDPEGLDRQY